MTADRAPPPDAPADAASQFLSQGPLAAALDASGIGLVQIDPVSRTLLAANAAFGALCGHPPDALRGMPLERLNHPDDPFDAIAFAALLANGGASGQQRRLVRRDGTTVWVQLSARVLPAANDLPPRVLAIAQDITAQQRMHAELETAHADLQRLLDALDHAREAERQRIAHDLHDDVQQSLAGLLMEAGAARLKLGTDPPAVGESLARIEDQARQVIGSARRIIHDLRPLAIEELGLVAALRELATRLANPRGPVCTVDTAALTADDERRLPPVAASLYRIAQEALSNVIRHASARHARIELASGSPGVVWLTISDDGVGMSSLPPQRPGGLGLAGIRERARALGGALRIRGGLQGGTTLEVELPLPGADRR